MAGTTVVFDTLKYTKILEEAGIGRKQAEAQIKVMNSIVMDSMNNVATKADIERMKDADKANTDRMEAAIGRLEISHKADIGRVETAITNLEKVMRAGMATKGDLWKVAMGCATLIIGGFGVVLAMLP